MRLEKKGALHPWHGHLNGGMHRIAKGVALQRLKLSVCHVKTFKVVFTFTLHQKYFFKLKIIITLKTY
jgi:hypothetical protein